MLRKFRLEAELHRPTAQATAKRVKIAHGKVRPHVTALGICSPRGATIPNRASWGPVKDQPVPKFLGHSADKPRTQPAKEQQRESSGRRPQHQPISEEAPLSKAPSSGSTQLTIPLSNVQGTVHHTYNRCARYRAKTVNKSFFPKNLLSCALAG
jgi:hypothetical protein